MGAPPAPNFGIPQGAPGGAMVPIGGAPMMQGGGGFGPIGTDRNPVMVTLIGMVCFVYAIIQMLGMLNELKAFRQKDDFNPIFLFLPILNLLLILGLPDKVYDAKVMAGVPNAQKPNVILYLLLGIYFLPADLNEIWAAAKARGGR